MPCSVERQTTNSLTYTIRILCCRSLQFLFSLQRKVNLIFNEFQKDNADERGKMADFLPLFKRFNRQ